MRERIAEPAQLGASRSRGSVAQGVLQKAQRTEQVQLEQAIDRVYLFRYDGVCASKWRSSLWR